MLIVPSDHLVLDQSSYQARLKEAISLASKNHLVTFGIKPAYAETGYGYIEASVQDVKSFKEKPSLEMAQKYVSAGNFFWNSGMFCFKSGVFLEELKKYAPDIYATSTEAFNMLGRNKSFGSVWKT
jgi:mannose-1-phosphate guanylyltransferase